MEVRFIYISSLQTQTKNCKIEHEIVKIVENIE